MVVFAFDVVIKGNERFWSRVGFSLDYLICLRITISECSKLTEIVISFNLNTSNIVVHLYIFLI